MAEYDYSGLNTKIKHSHKSNAGFIEMDENSWSRGDTFMQGNGWMEFKGEMIKANFRYIGNFNWDKPEKSVIQAYEISAFGYGSSLATGLNWNVGEMQSMPMKKFVQKSLKDDDRIIGTKYNDKINGYGGDDVIDGGAGKNILTGGKGADVFVLSNKGLQIIKDFDFDEGDELDFSRISLGGDLDLRDIGKHMHVYIGDDQVAILKNV